MAISLLEAAELAIEDLKNMSTEEFIALQENCGTDIAYAIDPTLFDEDANERK